MFTEKVLRPPSAGKDLSKSTKVFRRDAARVVLTIAGSDSGGGAGIQADLKTFAALGVWGTSAITCLTAQNPAEVCGILPITPAMVALQVKTVCSFYRVLAIKTGMLYSAAIIAEVARVLARLNQKHLVVDPVMVASSGKRLLRPQALRVLEERLLPLADVITPNVPEAEVLASQTIGNLAQMETAARAIGKRYRAACIVKGGHLPGNEVVDVLFYAGGLIRFRSERWPRTPHGTGCRFSAALTAFLALGLSLPKAVKSTKHYLNGLMKQK